MLGILPGNGAVLGPFASYTVEKRLARDPGRFGRGAIEGVAGPEAANNAGAQTSFIPLLALGIPPNAVMALMVGAMTIHGIVPGPLVMVKSPRLFWGLIASMWIGNLMLLVINLPLVRLWVRFLDVPVPAHVPGDPALLLHRHLLGEQLARATCSCRRGSALARLGRSRSSTSRRRRSCSGSCSGGSWRRTSAAPSPSRAASSPLSSQRPLSGALLAVAVLVLALAVLPAVRRGREEVFTE